MHRKPKPPLRYGFGTGDDSVRRNEVIDNEERKKAAEVVRRFISGRITNFDFEKNMPATKDLAVQAIEDSLWLLYDDFEKHKLDAERTLPAATKSQMARWVMFLHTDEEYRWPTFRYPGLLPLKHGLVSRLLKKPLREYEFMSSGEYDVWPFISKAQFEHAKQKPVLLAAS